MSDEGTRAVKRARKVYEDDCLKAGRDSDPRYLVDLHFHDLRHEATSTLANDLPNVIELAAVTGHKDIRMLKRYYHPKAEDLAKKLRGRPSPEAPQATTAAASAARRSKRSVSRSGSPVDPVHET